MVRSLRQVPAGGPQQLERIDGQARDAAFTVLVIAELARSFGARSNTLTVWQMGLFSNIRLFLIVLASLGLQLSIHHVGALQAIFRTEPITIGQCLVWAALGFIPLVILEARKRMCRTKRTIAGSRQPAA